jgi:thiamine monophosphate kinase
VIPANVSDIAGMVATAMKVFQSPAAPAATDRR